jgi:hypothetical protein
MQLTLEAELMHGRPKKVCYRRHRAMTILYLYLYLIIKMPNFWPFFVHPFFVVRITVIERSS